MRPTYVRPLVVTFTAFGLACLFSYAAIALTEPDSARPATKADAAEEVSAERSTEAKAAAAFAKIKREAAGGDPPENHDPCQLLPLGQRNH